MPASDPHNLVGVTLGGRYRIEKPIGEGGMGAIFLATQLSLGRPVAIKVMKPASGVVGATPHDENVKRFERETEVIARLAHPNIVQVVDAGKGDDGTLFLAMELLDGENVRQVLKHERSLPIARALSIVEDVASALVAAHQGGVIHRDLKAENVMLVTAAGKDETAKVLDFGVAKLTSQTAAPPVTGSGFVAGTPGCIAPEQMLGTTDDPRSDLYSVGVLLFEMLAGQAPFAANTTMELMLKHLQQPAPRVADVARQYGYAEVPAPLDALVASLLAKDPQERPPDAKTLRDIVRAMRDASRATVADINVAALSSAPRLQHAGLENAVPIGSRVVATPPISLANAPTPSPAPTQPTPAALVSAPASSSPAALGSAPLVVPPTSATTAAPAPTWERPRGPIPLRVKVKVASRFVLVFIAVGLAVFVFRQYTAWRANETSHKPEAKAMISRAIDDFWNLDLDKVEDEADAALAADPDDAPWASILKAGAKLADRRPLSRVDADLARARVASDRRMSMMVERTSTSGLITILTTTDPKALTVAAGQHCAAFGMGVNGCTPLDAALISERLIANSGTPEQIHLALEWVDAKRPLGLWLNAVYQEELGNLDEAHKLLEQAERLAPGRPTLVDELANVELRQGKRAEAMARLEKLAARDDGIAIRLAKLRARDDKDAFKGIIERVRGLPVHDERRIDELASIGSHLASLGRFQEAEAFWKQSIDDRAPGDAIANARALEMASVAVLFGLVAGDHEMAQRWFDVVRDIPYVSGPGADRLAAFLLAARALMHTFGDGPVGPEIEQAKGELKLLEQTPNDIPVIATTVRFYVALRERRLDDAMVFAREFTTCFQPRNMALIHLYQGDLQKAADVLDAGLTQQMEDLCTSGDDTVHYIEAVGFAQGLGERAGLAMALHQEDKARAYVERFHQVWRFADPAVDAMPFGGNHEMGRVQVERVEKALGSR